MKNFRLFALVSLALLQPIIGCKQSPSPGSETVVQAKTPAPTSLPETKRMVIVNPKKVEVRHTASNGDTLKWFVGKTDNGTYYVNFHNNNVCVDSNGNGNNFKAMAGKGNEATCTLKDLHQEEFYTIDNKPVTPKPASPGPTPAGIAHCNGCIIDPPPGTQ
jgi:hypothetical protein